MNKIDFDKSGKISVFLKFAEISLLCTISVYSAIKGNNINWIIVSILFLILFLIWFIDYKLIKPNLRTIYSYVRYFYDNCRFNSDADVRITIHKKINDYNYKHFIKYYPKGKPTKGKIPISKGIVKYAFENAYEEFSENFTDLEDKKTKLKESYFYSESEAIKRLEDGQMSYFCIPLKINEKTWGVIYMNAQITNTFPEKELLSQSKFLMDVKTLAKLVQDEIEKG